MNYVEEILERSKAIHLRKSEDYATNPTFSAGLPTEA